MTEVDPTFARGKALTGWSSNDGTEGTNVDPPSCINDDITNSNCISIGTAANACLRLEIPNLITAVVGDTITIHHAMAMNFDTMACLPYNTANGVATGNKLTAATSGNPMVFTLTAAWIADLHDLGSGKAAYRLVEDLALPIAGTDIVRENACDITLPAATFGGVPIGAFLRQRRRRRRL